jgi:Fe-S-cluster formation regulator IscX/YfhJ
MASFPTLKTSAVMQYPASKVVAFQNQVVRFVDGTEQRYRDCAGPLHRWIIRLDELDETEMAALEQFLESNQGSFGDFSFTDPWDNQVYGNCSFGSDAINLTSVEAMRGNTSVTVKENRG